MAYRYYSTLRPLMVGGIPFPKQPGESITTIVNFEEGRTYCKDIDRPAWGYIEYTAPLDQQQVSNYELMQANPELPVIPCVDGDVVSGDEYYCWLGSWGESAVQEFVIGRERTYYREDDISEMNDVLCEHYDPELVDNMTEEETRAAYNALPWKKAIFVDVHQYEEEPDAEV